MDIQKALNDILNAVYGVQVRQAIHDVGKLAYDKAVEALKVVTGLVLRQDEIENKFVQVQKDSTNTSPSGAETVAARGTYPTLDARLDDSESKANLALQNEITVRKQADDQLNDRKADKTYVDSVVKQIGQAGPLGVYPSLSALTTAKPTGDKGTYVTTDNGHWYYWDLGSWRDGGVYQGTQSSEFSATNIALNPDFKNGTYGWINVAGTTNAPGEYLELVADGSQNYHIIQQSLTNLVVGHKYFVFGKSNVDNSLATLIGVSVTGAKETITTVQKPIANEFYQLAGLYTATQTTHQLQFRHQYADATTAKDKKMYLDNVIVFDASATFAGNVPSVSQILEILSYRPESFFKDTVAPIADNGVIFNIFNKMRNSSIKLLKGTAKQIDVVNGDGVNGNPTVSIPKNPMLMQPEKIATKYGDNIAPNFGSAIATNATFENGKWIVNENGTLTFKVLIEANKPYLIDLDFDKPVIDSTTNYGKPLTDVPHMQVKLGDAISSPLFIGYSDAIYEIELTSTVGGEVDLVFGSGSDGWYGIFTGLTVKPILERVTPAGKIGLGVFDVLTYAYSLAFGNGLQKRSSGDMNIAIGFNTLLNLTTGWFNNAMGTYVFENLKEGSYNTGMGQGTGRSLLSGFYNVLFGYCTAEKLKAGSWNVILGNEACRDMVIGDRNTVVGSRALNDMTNGNCNIAMGREAGLYPNGKSTPTKKGDFNTFLGYRTGQYSLVDAQRSVAVGANATTHTDAVALGFGALAGGLGSVAVGRDSSGKSAVAYLENEFMLGTEKHHVKIPGKLNVKQYTPTSTADPVGIVGDICADDNYIYTKTSAGWKRTPSLETF